MKILSDEDRLMFDEFRVRVVDVSMRRKDANYRLTIDVIGVREGEEATRKRFEDVHPGDVWHFGPFEVTE